MIERPWRNGCCEDRRAPWKDVEATAVARCKDKLMRRLGECTVAISTWGRRRFWSASVNQLQEMRRSCLDTDVIKYSAANTACAKG